MTSPVWSRNRSGTSPDATSALWALALDAGCPVVELGSAGFDCAQDSVNDDAPIVQPTSAAVRTFQRMGLRIIRLSFHGPAVSRRQRAQAILGGSPVTYEFVMSAAQASKSCV